MKGDMEAVGRMLAGVVAGKRAEEVGWNSDSDNQSDITMICEGDFCSEDESIPFMLGVSGSPALNFFPTTKEG